MKTVEYLLLLLCLIGWVHPLRSQDVALKSNVFYWAATTPNLGVEYKLSPTVSLKLQGNYNPFRYGDKERNRKLRHWVVMPAAKVWLYETFDGPFYGIHTFYGRYNMGGIKFPAGIFPGLKDSRYEGWGAGAGLSAGYQWYLSPRWNIEAEFGFGYAYLDYKKFECARCGLEQGRNTKHYFGPTRVSVAMVWLW